MNQPPQQQPAVPHSAATQFPMLYRSMYQPYRDACFWHSDVQDAVELLYDAACRYSPDDREEFIRSVCEGALKDFPALPQPVNGCEALER